MNLIMLGLFSAFTSAETGVKPEPVYGVSVLDEQRIEFKVKSTGCTRARDFSLSYENRQIRLIRHQADKCRRKAYLKTIILGLPELDHPFSLSNPFAAHSLEK